MTVNCSITIKKVKGKKEDIRCLFTMLRGYAEDSKGVFLTEEKIRESVSRKDANKIGNQLVHVDVKYINSIENLMKKLKIRATLKLWLFDDDSKMLIRGYTKRVK